MALLFALSAFWGASFLFIKVAVQSVPPLTVVAGRLLLAAALLAVFVHLRGARLPASLRAWRSFAVIGIAGNVLPFALINWGEIRIESGLAAILIGTMPIFTVLIAHRFTRDERLTRDKLAGIALGFAGLAVLVGPGALAGLGGDIAAELAVCAAAASYAATAVYSRRLARVSPEVAAAGSIIAGAAIALPLSLAFDRPWALAPSGQALAAIAALAVLSTALAAVIFFHLLASAGATFTALSNYLIPPSGLLWGVLFLAERPSLNALLALAMILAAVAVVGHGAPRPAGGEGKRRRAAETRR